MKLRLHGADGAVELLVRRHELHFHAKVIDFGKLINHAVDLGVDLGMALW